MSHKVRGGGRRCARWLTSLALGWTGFAVEGRASAARVFENVNVAPMYERNVTWTAGSTHTVRTIWLSSGCDTMLHIHRSGVDDAANDDDPAGGLGSAITFTVPTTGIYTIAVHAMSDGTSGSASVEVDGTILDSSIDVAGSLIPITPGTNRLETARLAGIFASDDTRIHAVAWVGGRLSFVGRDDNSGVGLMSRLDVGSSVTYVLVTEPYGRIGWSSTSLYVNDYTTDSDGDGLGDALEAELGTCATATGPFCSGLGAHPAFDTDRDGLNDEEELFGVESPTDPLHPQYLRAWGADPLHKDKFIEIDWSTPALTSHNLDSGMLEAIWSRFNSPGTAAALRNPDGLDGISLHFDVAGFEYNPLNPKYGDFGGSGPSNEASAELGVSTRMIAVRRRRFNYGMMTGGGGGTATADWFNVVPDGHALAHELGHDFGLQHWGYETWGIATCKPNYPSIMSYLSIHEEFSRGLITAAGNPADFVQAGMFPADFDTSYLHAYPYFYDYDGSSLRPVDFLRYGTLDISMTHVRGAFGDARAAPAGCSVFTNNPTSFADSYVDATPHLARIGSRMYSFWVGADGVIRYKHGLINGPGSAGSCPGGGTLGDTCTTFSATVATSLTGTGFQVVVNGTGLLFAVRSASGNVVVTPVSGTDGSGNLTGFGSPVTVTTTVAAPELSPIFTTTAAKFALVTNVYDAGVLKYRWHTSPDGVTWTAKGAVATADGDLEGVFTPSLTAFPPVGVTQGDATRTVCGAFTKTNSGVERVRMLCLNRDTVAWADHTASFFKDSEACGKYPHAHETDPDSGTCTYGPETVGPPSLVFRMGRKNDGSLIGTGGMSDTVSGQFWLVWTVASPEIRTAPDIHFQTPIVFNSNAVYWNSAFTRSPAIDYIRYGAEGYWGNIWHNVARGTNIAQFEDVTLGATKAIGITDFNTPPAAFGGHQVTFYPFPDGSVSTVMRDGDDFKVMEYFGCSFLNPTRCGAPAWTVSP